MKKEAKTPTVRVLLAFSVCLACLCGCDAKTDEAETEIPEDETETVPEDETEDLPSEETEEPVLSYITPEQYGAVGDGSADDTSAFKKCLESSEKNILLSGKYRITENITAITEKRFIAKSPDGQAGASIICEPAHDSKTLTFHDNVTFENIEFYSTLLRPGQSPHKEIYARTSNVIFVEVWNKNGTFTNCTFTNALIAIRGRKTESSPVIPQSITADGCTFTECKIPVQGYSENTLIKDCTFLNDGELYRKLDKAAPDPEKYNGDLYGGDHCVYIERYGCRSLVIRGCRVETKNCESGHAFQIYGEPKPGDVIPELHIEDCEIYANGITSSSAANVSVDHCKFYEQRSGQFILIAESGSAAVRNCEFHHAYAFSYADSSVQPYAENCLFERLPSLGDERCNFPQESVNCEYINWGGNVRVPDTRFTDCTFSYTEGETLNGLYINNSQGYPVYLKNTRFKSGSDITNNEKAVKESIGCGTFN